MLYGLSLQQGIENAGGVMSLLWKHNPEELTVPVVRPEFSNWQDEQTAWFEGVAFLDLSHHMTDLFIEGPDALKLLSYLGANNFENFAIGQAKQFVPVTEEGFIVTDGVLMRLAEDKFNLVGVPASQPWVTYHANKGRYDVELRLDPDSRIREPDRPPVFFRYQIQGPRAEPFLEKVFGQPMPKIKFFHSEEVSLNGKVIRAFRHGMVGQPGYEFIGDWSDADYIRKRLLEVGREFGLSQTGGRAYFTNQGVSGWIPTPLPAIYTSSSCKGYRDYLPLNSFEGRRPLYGSFFSPNPEDYYVSPFELGYDRSVSFNHEFLGRDALIRAKGNTLRKKVSLIWETPEAARIIGADRGRLSTWSFDRVEKDGRLVGLSHSSCYIQPMNTTVSLAVVELEFAEPGTEVTLVWGNHPGKNGDVGGDFGFVSVPAKVGPAPINDYARREYRKN